MAFCTKCGATIAGAFCRQCGAPTGQAAQPDQPIQAGQPAAVPPPPRRKTSPLIWILVIIVGIFGIGILGVVGTTAFFVHKARRAGVDAELFRTDPSLAIGRLLAATNRNLEVIDTDSDSGRVTVRDRRTGKHFTVSFDDARRGRLTLKADDGEGKVGTFEVGGSAKLPSWIPDYPGSKPEPVFSARGETDESVGEAGNFHFTTDDPASRVLAFYESKARELGMTLHTAGAGDAATVIARDDDHHRFLKVIAVGGSGQTTVNVTYGRKL